MKLKKYARQIFWTLMSLAVTALIVICGAYFYLITQLPNVETLKDVQLQVPLRIYTSDGKLIGEFGEMRRNPINYQRSP